MNINLFYQRDPVSLGEASSSCSSTRQEAGQEGSQGDPVDVVYVDNFIVNIFFFEILIL